MIINYVYTYTKKQARDKYWIQNVSITEITPVFYKVGEEGRKRRGRPFRDREHSQLVSQVSQVNQESI